MSELMPPTPDEIAEWQAWSQDRWHTGHDGTRCSCTCCQALRVLQRLLTAYVAQREEIERLTTERDEWEQQTLIAEKDLSTSRAKIARLEAIEQRLRQYVEDVTETLTIIGPIPADMKEQMYRDGRAALTREETS